MKGMNASTGKALSGIDHIRQSIRDILTTPIGTRVMRRDYGSEIPELLDQPDNGATRVRLYAATVAALLKWEPRIRVTRVVLNTDDTSAQGTSVLDLYCRTVSGTEFSARVAMGGIA